MRPSCVYRGVSAIKAGVSTACLYPVYVENAVDILGSSGIDSVEIFFNSDSELNESFVKDIKNILDRYGTSCVSVHPFTCELDNLMFFSKYIRRLEDSLEYHKRYFNAMNILGAEVFVFHGNALKTAVSAEFYLERLNRLRSLGKSFGITVSQENVERCQSGSLDFLESLVKLDSSIELTIDIKQCIRSGENPVDFAERLGRNIVHVHISDNDNANDCIQIGKGTFDIENFLCILKKNGFDSNVIIELYSSSVEKPVQLADNCKKLTEIIERI